MELRHFPQPKHWPSSGAYPDEAEAGKMNMHSLYRKGFREVEFLGMVLGSNTMFGT